MRLVSHVRAKGCPSSFRKRFQPIHILIMGNHLNQELNSQYKYAYLMFSKTTESSRLQNNEIRIISNSLKTILQITIEGLFRMIFKKGSFSKQNGRAKCQTGRECQAPAFYKLSTTHLSIIFNSLTSLNNFL